MRILHVAPAYYPATFFGGPIFSVYGLCNALVQECGVELKVLTTDAAGLGVSDRLEAATVPLRYPAGYDVFLTNRLAGISISVGLLRHLPALVRWADVVHLTAVYSFPTMPTLLACRILRKPLVWSPRGSLQATHEWAGAKKRRLKRIWASVCGAMVSGRGWALHVTSERERVASLAQISNINAIIVRNGVEVPADLPPRNRLPDKKLRLLFIGRLDPKKGLENLLEALHWLDDSSIALEICGTGDGDYLTRLELIVRNLGLGDQVHFRGHVDGDQKRAAFLRSDLCVVPSHSENFGMVVAEALAHGLPVIAGRATPWADLEVEGCGLWVDNSPDRIAEAVRQVRSMDILAMGARGRTWMVRRFGWGAIAREMLELYQRVGDDSRSLQQGKRRIEAPTDRAPPEG